MTKEAQLFALNWCSICHRIFIYPFESPYGHLTKHKKTTIEGTDFRKIVELAYNTGHGWIINDYRFKEVK